jgi:hypothetical protein
MENPETLDEAPEYLNQIYPPTGLVRKPMGGILSESYAQHYYPPKAETTPKPKA